MIFYFELNSKMSIKIALLALLILVVVPNSSSFKPFLRPTGMVVNSIKPLGLDTLSKYYASEAPGRISTSLPSTAGAIASNEKKSTLFETYKKVMDIATIMFPVWTVLFAGIALKRPETFAWFSTNYFTWSLG